MSFSNFDIEEFIGRNYKKIFLLVPFLLFLAYGIQVYFYTAFNLLYSSDISIFSNMQWDNLMKKQGLLSNLFLKYLKYFFRVPAGFFLASIVQKFIVLLLIFKICEFFTKNKYHSFIITLLFTLSSETHGHIFNGIWGSPIFYRASISALFTLGGIYFVLQERLIIASVLFSLSLHFHSIDGFSALAFFATGYFYYTIKNNKLTFRKYLIPSLIILVTLFSFYLILKNLTLPGLKMTIGQWYTFIFNIDPDDVLLLWTLSNYGYVLLPLLFFSIYIAFKNRDEKNILYDFLFGAISLFILTLIIEVLHKNGIFFGKLSELFISMQLKRGIWVLYFFVITVIVQYLLKIEIKNKTDVFLIGFFIFTYLLTTFLGAVILAIFLFLKFNKKFLILSLLFLNFLCLFYFYGEPKIWGFRSITLSIVFSVIFYLLYAFKKVNYKSLFAITISVFLLVFTIRGVHENKFVNDLNLINNNGFFNYPDFRKTLIDVYSLYDGTKYDTEIYNAIEKVNINHEIILFPLDRMSECGKYLIGSPVFLASIDFCFAIYNKKYFEYIMYKTSILFNLEKPESIYTHATEEQMYNKILKEKYLGLTPEYLKFLNQSQKIRFFVTTKYYDDLKLLHKSKIFYLYDLEKTTEPKN